MPCKHFAAALNHNNNTIKNLAGLSAQPKHIIVETLQEKTALLTVAISQHLKRMVANHSMTVGVVTQKARTGIYKHENNPKKVFFRYSMVSLALSLFVF